MINLKHIPAILAIVQEGSITAAAKKLYVSQPALSQMIRHEEESLGCELFIRDGNRIRLTEEGRMYVEAAQQIQTIDDNLHARIADSKENIKGEFSIGISTQRGLQLLPRVIPGFSKLYPYVRIRLMEEGSGRLERLVTEGECDMAFITTNYKRNSLHYHLIENEKLVLIASKATRLAASFPDGATLDITQAKDESFISMLPGHSVRQIQDRLFEEHGLDPQVILETHNMEAAKRIVTRANAVFLIPSVYLDDLGEDREKINVYNIKNADYERHFYFCYRQGLFLTRYEKDMVRLVCEALGVPYALKENE